jgi:hypothetical protein
MAKRELDYEPGNPPEEMRSLLMEALRICVAQVKKKEDLSLTEQRE